MRIIAQLITAALLGAVVYFAFTLEVDGCWNLMYWVFRNTLHPFPEPLILTILCNTVVIGVAFALFGAAGMIVDSWWPGAHRAGSED